MYDWTHRKSHIAIFIQVLAVVIIARFVYIQLIDPSYKIKAELNAMVKQVQYPSRGLIMDRHGKVLVENQTVYDINVIPKKVEAFDTTELAYLLGMTKEDVVRNLQEISRRAKGAAAYQPQRFVKLISAETYGLFQEKWFKFPGFYPQARTTRAYPARSAGNLLGYIGEVSRKDMETDPYYGQGFYIGKTGIEKAYEKQLRGVKGVNIYVRDVLNRVVEAYEHGKYDTLSIPGENIYTTIDFDLQDYGEKLMAGKTGSIVAIEPATGEILSLVSSPTFDPNLFMNIYGSSGLRDLRKNPLNPLFNRAIMAQYPPGSIFKTVNALIGLQDGVITPQSRFTCNHGYAYGGKIMKCHSHAPNLDLPNAISNSCNAYFCNVYRLILEQRKFNSVEDGYEHWRLMVNSFGIGTKLHSDFVNELKGILPTSAYFNKYFGKGRWNAFSNLSMAIGQGELGVTPLHMANLAAIIANRGFYYIPHVAKKIVGDTIPQRFLKPIHTQVDAQHFDPVVYGMWMAVNGEAGGTARMAKVPGVEVCGKTGTAQNPHGKDHSVFVAFAPKDNPKIAIAVYVENGGFGATWAAPIASLMIEKYITKKVTRGDLEKRMMESKVLYYVKPNQE